MNKIMFFSGIILMSTILILFPDYNLPVPKEVYRESIGQIIIFLIGLLNLIFGIFTNDTATINKASLGGKE